MSIILDLRNTTNTIKKLEKLVQPASMNLIGQKVKQYNLEQIDKQKEATGKTVKPYSKKYAEEKGETVVTYVGKEKKKKKKKRKKAIHGKKKRRGGHMLFAFDVKTKLGQSQIGFFSKKAKQKAKWNMRHRKFIGLTKQNAKKLIKWVKKKFKL